jgi:hypothetical protein
MTEPEQSHEEGQFHPKGTILVLILFMIVLIALWASVYFILLSRGVTL